MVETDPVKRINVLVGQLRCDILWGPCTNKLAELAKCREKAIDLYFLCDYDRQIIERAFPLSKELEEYL